MSHSERLLVDIDAFLKKVGVAETTFGRLAANDGKFVGRIRTGARFWPETEQKVGIVSPVTRCRSARQ